MPDFTAPTSQSLAPGLTGNINLPGVSPLYIDGIPVDQLSSNQVNTSSGLDTNDSHFWATPVRLPDAADTTDVFEVLFSVSERVNTCSFQIARFPHSAFLEYFDAPSQSWIACKQDNGLPANVFVSDSLPAVCWTAPTDNSHLHPQHFGTGHWLTYNFKLFPVQTAQMRLRLIRVETGNGPKDPLGNTIPYSLGVKDFVVGYVVSGQSDVPIVGVSDDNPNESNTISTSTDILGSPVDFVVRTNDASQLLASTGIWKCAPQPVANAVVSLYSDLRLSNGSAQVIDRVYMNPVYSGCTVNMYYSNDSTEQETFQANTSDLPTTFTGLLAPTVGVDGIIFSGSSGLVLDNTMIQFDQSKPFQLGLIFNPIFPSTDLTPRTIYDDGNLKITWGPSLSLPFGVDVGDPSTYGGFTITLGTNITSIPMTFSSGGAVQWYITWTGEQLSVDVPQGQDTTTLVNGAAVNNINASTAISLGANIDGTGEGDFVLRSLILKVGNPDAYPAMQNFWNDPDSFVTIPVLGSSTSTDNAILRYSNLQVSAANQYGFTGGPSVVFDELSWVPIARSYQLKMGFYDFEPIHAKFLKLEFSNLSAQPYETSTPVVAEIKMFAANTTPLTGQAGPSNQAAAQSLDVHAGYASWNRFNDQSNLASNNAIPPYAAQPYLPTEVKFSADPESAASLNSAAPYWNFVNQHQSPTMAQFQVAGTHVYKTAMVPFEQRIAFFVGLSNFQVFRTNMTTDEDTNQWVELFYDDLYLEYPDPLNTWAFQDPDFKTGITTPEGMTQPAVVTSPILNSYRVVRGLQYATTQSPPAQLIPDPDFNDSALQFWQPYGNSTVTSDSFYDRIIGGVAKVTIANNVFLWSSMEATYPTWQDIEDSDPNQYLPRWEDLESSPFISQAGGIQTVNPITPSTVGRLFVAARVLTPDQLTGPLTLDLINGDGTLLASTSVQPTGSMTEFFMEYRVGDTPVVGNTWDQVQATGTWDQEEALGSWDQVANRPEVLNVADLTVALYQNGATKTQTWYVDNLSLFDDAVLWEFSRDGGTNWYPAYDIKNNSSGVFIFPQNDASAVGTGSKFMWRLTGGAPHLNVSSLVIRPWYDSLLFGKRPTRLNTYGGPNLSPYDHFPNTQDDPRFKMWDGPIPQDWYFAFRSKLASDASSPPVLAPGYASDAMSAGSNEGLPPVPSPHILPVSIVYGV